MRLPGAGLLIVIGLFLLWIASTGKIDKLGAAWDYVRSKSDLPGPNERDIVKPTATTADTVRNGILHVESFHMNSMMETLQPGSMAPGGLN